MRILLLGSDAEMVGTAEPRRLALNRLAAALETRLGEPVPTRFAAIEPGVALVEQAVSATDEFGPDLVLLHCPGLDSASQAAEATSARRLGGRLGRAVEALAPRLGVDPLSANSRRKGATVMLYYAGHDAVMLLVKTPAILPAKDDAEPYRRLVRAVADRPNTEIIVRGPPWQGAAYSMKPVHKRVVRRLDQLDRAIEVECRAVGVPFYSLLALTGHNPLRYTLTDRVHFNDACHQMMAATELALIERHVLSRRSATPAPEQTSTPTKRATRTGARRTPPPPVG